MVQMVFVHGVSNRDDLDGQVYERARNRRDRRFQTVGFKGAPVTIRNSYWGKYGADPQWKLTCIPRVSGSPQAEPLAIGDLMEGHELALSAIEDFSAVVAGLSVSAIEEAEATGDESNVLEAEKLWTNAADYAANFSQPGLKPSWLTPDLTNAEFVEYLRQEVESQADLADLGIFDAIKSAAAKLAGRASNLVNGPAVKIVRQKLTPSLAVFVGDVFRYLKEGSGRLNIRKVVANDIVAAAKAARKNDERLVLAGHSMGAVILYDMLTDADLVHGLETEIGGPLKIDLLLTIGSQVALFEELKVYQASDPANSAMGSKAPSPPAAEVWWNVFDTVDVLSFLAAPVFEKVVDLEMDTVAGIKNAHGAYFNNMVFYRRLNARMVQAGIIV